MRTLLAVALAVLAAGAACGLLRGHPVRADPGPRVQFSSGGRTYEIDLSGRNRRALPLAPRSSEQGRVELRDGSRIVGRRGRLIHLGARGHRLGDLGTGAYPELSPDGMRLTFSVFDSSPVSSQLWVMDADGSHRRLLARLSLGAVSTWSPDGGTILFARYAARYVAAEDARAWLETVPATGGTTHRLTTSGYDSGGHYSPDGRWIVFASGRNRVGKVCGEDECRYSDELFAMRPDGSDQHQIGHDRIADGGAIFATPTTIVYSRTGAERGDSELYRIELDGTCRARLTRDALGDDGAVALPGAVQSLGGCLPPTPLRELPFGPNFDAANSRLTPAKARRLPGDALWWVGRAAGAFVLTTIDVNQITSPGGAPAQSYAILYACSPDIDDCTRHLQLIETPVCARPTLPATGHGAISALRGVPRIRYVDRDELLLGRTIITIYGDSPARELAERELRSLSPSAGRVGPGQKLPAPSQGILKGIACQPPATSGPLPAHP
jgi:hypothetical protein